MVNYVLGFMSDELDWIQNGRLINSKFRIFEHVFGPCIFLTLSEKDIFTYSKKDHLRCYKIKLKKKKKRCTPVTVCEKNPECMEV